MLSEELGLEPPPELAELEALILAHDEALGSSIRVSRGCAATCWTSGSAPGVRARCTRPDLPGVDRDVAVRVVPEAVANDPDFVRSFDAMHAGGVARSTAVVPL